MNEAFKQQVLTNITFESAKSLLGSTSWIENYDSPDAFELTTTEVIDALELKFGPN